MNLLKRIARIWKERKGVYVDPVERLKNAKAADDFERDPFRISKIKACERSGTPNKVAALPGGY